MGFIAVEKEKFYLTSAPFTGFIHEAAVENCKRDFETFMQRLSGVDQRRSSRTGIVETPDFTPFAPICTSLG